MKILLKHLQKFRGKLLLDSLFKRSDKRITVAGMESTGSTFVYQIVTALGAKSKKVHHYVPDSSFKLVTYRDPRDVICSYARRQLRHLFESHGIEYSLITSHKKLFHEYKRQEDLRRYQDESHALLIRYEKYFGGNENELVNLLADCLGMTLDNTRERCLLEKFSLEMNKRRSEKFSNFKEYDQATYIHGNHISNNGLSGTWKQFFTEPVYSIVKRDLGSFLIEFGYEKDFNW